MAKREVRVTQRWDGGEAGDDDESMAPVRKSKAASLPMHICSTKRVLLELLVFVVLAAWVLLIAYNLASKLDPCHVVPVAHELGNRFVSMRSWNGAMHWNVGGDGVLSVARKSGAANASFHVEWQARARAPFHLYSHRHQLPSAPPGGRTRSGSACGAWPTCAWWRFPQPARPSRL